MSSRVTLVLALSLFILAAHAEVLDAVSVRSLAAKFATDDAHGRAVAYTEFETRVPAEQRVVALSELWEAVADQPTAEITRQSLLAYLARERVERLAWDERLRRHLSEARQGGRALRELALRAFVRLDQAEARDEILGFLDDSDDTIRNAALIVVSRWSDGRPRLQAYIDRYTASPAHAASVERARFLLTR
jgi:hypothetical protein